MPNFQLLKGGQVLSWLHSIKKVKAQTWKDLNEALEILIHCALAVICLEKLIYFQVC